MQFPLLVLMLLLQFIAIFSTSTYTALSRELSRLVARRGAALQGSRGYLMLLWLSWTLAPYSFARFVQQASIVYA